MDRKRELKQFKYLMYTTLFIYPFWLAYGLWSEAYAAPISIGIMFIWGKWYISHIQKSVQGSTDTKVDWFSYSLEKYINFYLLVTSLFVAIIVGAIILVLVDYIFSII